MSLKKLGRYDLIRVLGRGAMGLVYEGRDPNLDRRVAIKTIKVENLSEEAATEYEVRFRTEARSAARLQHPNIVSVYDSDRDLDIAYLVMEFVQGDDLKHHLDKGEVYTLEQTLSIMADLLSALSYAHQQGVVHRDIKPANLLVIAGGRIKLADFGVARIQDSGDATRTQGTIVGTLKYMSPEQLEGKPIDARTDLFAAGVVLYQLITGKRPFDGDTDFAVIQKIVSHQPAAPTSFNARLPPALDAVLIKALAKSREARYATAQEFADALRAACQQASDVTIAPVMNIPTKGSNATWTATMMPGESLVTTESGVSISTGTSASLVTQEVELVYWKDIKDSNDITDLQGFLEKFPTGIYGDLARRRLRNLGVVTAADSGEATLVAPRPPTPDSESNYKTVILPKTQTIRSGIAPSKPVMAADAPPQLAGANAKSDSTSARSAPTTATSKTSKTSKTASAAPPSPPAKKSKMLWVAAAVVLVAAGGVFKMMTGARPTAELTAQSAASVLAASAAASSAAFGAASGPTGTAIGSTPSVAVPSLPVVAPPPLVVAPDVPTPVAAAAPAAVVAALPASRAIRPALAASRVPNALAAKKPTSEKEQPAAAVATPQPEPATTAATAAPIATAPAKAAAAAPSSPRTACEGRVLFSFQTCMGEQCAKPAFTQHPACIERRAMEERQREIERNR